MSEWIKEAPEFTEDDRRMEAEVILIEKLNDKESDLTELLDIYTKDNAELERIMWYVVSLIRQDSPTMNTLVANAMNVHKDLIQERLERAE